MALFDGTISDDDTESSGSDDLTTTLTKAQAALKLDTGNLDDPRIQETLKKPESAPQPDTSGFDDFSDVEGEVPSETYQGYGTIFGDKSDVINYRNAIASGATPKQALLVGDNGIGSDELGTINTTDVYGVAVPRWQLIKLFGPDPAAWRKARATITLGDKTVVVPIVDEGPGEHAQASGVVSDMTGPLAQYLGATGHDPVKVSYQANAGPDYMTDRNAWFKEQAKFGELGGFSDVEEGAKGEDFSDVEVKQPKSEFSDAEVATSGTKKDGTKEEPAPVVSKNAGNWLFEEIDKIWKAATPGLAQAKYGIATQSAKMAEIPDPMYEQEIAAIQASPYYSQSEKDQRIATLRGNQAQERANEAVKLPQAKQDLVKAIEEYKKANPGTFENFIGGLIPYAVASLEGPLGPYQIAAQASAEKFGSLIDDSTKQYKDSHPGVSDEEAFVHASKAVSEVARGAAGAQLALSVGFLDIPTTGPFLFRVAQKMGVGAATMEVTNTLAEVQGDMALKKDIDPQKKIGERLKDLDFHLTNIFGGALFQLPHASVSEFGRVPFVSEAEVTHEPGRILKEIKPPPTILSGHQTGGYGEGRTTFSGHQTATTAQDRALGKFKWPVIYPPNILNEKLGQPDDKQPQAQTVEENGETTSESSGTGEADKREATAAETKPAKEAQIEVKPKPGGEAEGAKTDLEEPAGHKVGTGAKPETEGDIGAAAKGKDRLYDRSQAINWNDLDPKERIKVVRDTRRQISDLYDQRFKPLFKALGIDFLPDSTRTRAASFFPEDFKIAFNPVKVAQLNYSLWRKGGLHWGRSEIITTMFQEELMHGAYYKYLRDQSVKIGEDYHDTVRRYTDKIFVELDRAAKKARANKDTAGAEVLEKAKQHSLQIYGQGKRANIPYISGGAELVRQLMQLRARNRLSETWYRPLWDTVKRDVIAPAIRTLHSLVGMVNERDLPTLYEVIEGAEKNYRMLDEQIPKTDFPSEIDASGGEGVNFPGEEFILPTREVVEKQPHTEELIKAWDEFRDKQSELHGMWSQLNKILKTLKKYDKNFPLDVDGIGKLLDRNPTVSPVIPTGIRQWLNAANNGLYRHIGQRMKAGGYETITPDGMIRKWIGAPDDVIPFPRILRPDVRKVMEGVLRDPRTGNLTKAAQDLFDEGVREGIWTDESELENWSKTYRQVYTENSSRPKMTNLERARVAKFPQFFYTYSPEAMIDSIFWQSTEIARLEAFGQKIDGHKLDAHGNRIAYSKQDLFDRTISAIESDTSLSTKQIRHAVNSIDSLRKIAYGQGWRGAFTRSIRGLSSFGLAGSPHTSAKIWTSMFFNVPQYRGLGRSLQGIWDHSFGGKHHQDVLELQRLGLKQDVPINIYDDPYTTKNAQQRAQEFFTLGLKLAGHALAQDNAKAITARISRMWITDAIEQLRSDPTMLKAKTRMIAEDIGRRGLDPQVFAQSHIDPKIIDRFVREDVNDLQTAYRPEDYPAWASTPGGSILFQFGHWAYNSARTITRDAVLPIGHAFGHGDAALGTRYLGRLMGVFMVSAGAEETWRWIDEHLFGRQPHVAVLAEILQAMNKHDGGVALWMLSNRLVQDIIGSPIVGLYGDISQAITHIGQRDAAGQVHFFDPRNPAGVSYLNGFLNAIDTWTRQGFKLSGTQISSMGSQMAAIIKGYYDIAEPILGYFGVGLPGHNEAVGHREASWVKSRQDLFYKSTGYPDHRETGAQTTPHTVYLQNLNEALLSGNVAKALDIKRRYQREQKLDDKTLQSSLRSSVNNHRPIPGGSAGKAFMKWALRDLPPQEIERMRHIDRVFRSTAQKAGIPISAGADQ